MKWKLRELDRQAVIRLEFLDTPGDEVTPGSEKVGKHFKNKRLAHGRLLLRAVRIVRTVQVVQIVPAVRPSIDSRIVVGGKSKGLVEPRLIFLSVDGNSWGC